MNEDDYGPLDALLISAGSATNAAKNQAAIKALTAARFLSELAGHDDLSRWAALERAQAERAMAEHGRMYEPLRQSFPYISAIGEALPSVFLGLRGMGQQMQFNLGRTFLDQAAQGSQNPLLEKIARGLRSY